MNWVKNLSVIKYETSLLGFGKIIPKENFANFFHNRMFCYVNQISLLKLNH